MLITGRDCNAEEPNAEKHGKIATAYLPHSEWANASASEHSKEEAEDWPGARSPAAGVGVGPSSLSMSPLAAPVLQKNYSRILALTLTANTLEATTFTRRGGT